MHETNARSHHSRCHRSHSRLHLHAGAERGGVRATPPGAVSLNPIGTIGKGEYVLKDGKEVVLFEHQGKGCLSHFWFGVNFKGAENTRIRYYVDGEKAPSIDMELYLGHGIGFGDNQAP